MDTISQAASGIANVSAKVATAQVVAQEPIISLPHIILNPTPATTVTPLPSPVLGGAIGSDYLSTRSRLLFVEYSGNLSRYDLFPAATVLTSGTTLLKSSYAFSLDTGTGSVQGGPNTGFDIAINQVEPLGIYPLNGASMANLGVTPFAAITSATLQGLTYGTAYIPGPAGSAPNKLVEGDVFAVRTLGGNYAKVEVLSFSGLDMNFQWTTYKLASAYAVLGTGYITPEDVKASADGAHAYITERTGDLVRVPLATPNRSAATVVSTGMTAPQQLFLDEANNAAYTVEYAASGRLLRINLTTGAQITVLSGLNFPVGVVLSADRQSAYITEQTTGADGGRVSRYQLSSGNRTPLAHGLPAPFFLTWADASQGTLYLPERDPANTLIAVNAASGATNTVATGLSNRPSSVAVVAPGTLLVCCDQAIDELALPGGGVLLPGGPLLEGIGYIPFDWITAGGLADTSAHPTYHFQAINAPFGGQLWVVVNFIQANLDGASFYRVFMDGGVRTDVFNGAIWNGTEYVDAVFGPQTVGGQPGFYPVLTPVELSLWEGTPPGCLLNSTTLTSGVIHHLTVNFYDASGTSLPALTPASIPVFVDNRPCTATIAAPVLPGASADQCGVLAYTNTSVVVTIAYTAAQPGNFATYGFSVIKGINPVAGASGPVNPAPAPFTDPVSALLGGCTIAGYAAWVDVYATAIDGNSRQSQYDASAGEGFALAPGS